MKQQTVDEVTRALPAVAGTAGTWALHDWSMLVAILVGLCTIVYTVAQTVFLLRRWWLMEREGQRSLAD
jgi:hypothetical protein